MPMMANRPVGQGKRVRALLLAVVGGIMFGIVGMHGLSLAHSHANFANTSVSAMPAQGAGMAMSAAVIGDDGHPGHESPGEDDNCGFVACCLAVVIGGALLLWAVLSRWRQRPVAWVKRVPNSLRTHVVSALRPPPNLFSLGILRC